MKLKFEKGYKCEDDRKITLYCDGEAPSHLERLFWLRALKENEYILYSGSYKNTIDKERFKNDQHQLLSAVDLDNIYKSLYFDYIIVEGLASTSNFEELGEKYGLRLSGRKEEGKNLDRLWSELHTNNRIGIVDTRLYSFDRNP